MHMALNGHNTVADILSLTHKDQRVFNIKFSQHQYIIKTRLQELKKLPFNRFSKLIQQKCMELRQENLHGMQGLKGLKSTLFKKTICKFLITSCVR